MARPIIEPSGYTDGNFMVSLNNINIKASVSNSYAIQVKDKLNAAIDKEVTAATAEQLAQLREALGWETGSLEDVIAVLTETKNLFNIKATMGITEYVRFSGDRREAYKKLIQLMLRLNANNKQPLDLTV